MVNLDEVWNTNIIGFIGELFKNELKIDEGIKKMKTDGVRSGGFVCGESADLSCNGIVRETPEEAGRIVMDEQEKRKLDRKRARNRAAATKCRQKKIDRIQDLERMVANEKQRSQSLDMEMESLRGTLHQLQQLIQMHEQRGCVRS
ncbi:unnamed protein product [Angiostrongylus costaricensis]|uniref:BZIP domain-containing protein n=1 Tax=Angiostrongylus costaricensis TaxID=334426 RepID=A0A158PDJ6_ANGCS|nr:unnamed protein product [Angiostrongylus costaricensis]